MSSSPVYFFENSKVTFIFTVLRIRSLVKKRKLVLATVNWMKSSQFCWVLMQLCHCTAAVLALVAPKFQARGIQALQYFLVHWEKSPIFHSISIYARNLVLLWVCALRTTETQTQMRKNVGGSLAAHNETWRSVWSSTYYACNLDENPGHFATHLG